LAALESNHYDEKLIITKILTVIQVKTWYWGFSVARNSLKVKSKSSELLVALESKEYGKKSIAELSRR
tara:strand:+ start:450 stop:653 length:204 start_codon:yes stop_codon:yes gene_type:complete